MNNKLFITIIFIVAFVFVGGLLYISFSPIGPGSRPCNYNNSNKKYQYKNLEECSRAFIKCNDGENNFTDECGCGCEVVNNNNGEKNNSVKCNYNNTNKKYSYKNGNECVRADIGCKDGENIFTDECGCGCEILNENNLICGGWSDNQCPDGYYCEESPSGCFDCEGVCKKMEEGNSITAETCGQNNNGYCIHFTEKCKSGYESTGPDKCKNGRSADCCVSENILNNNSNTEQYLTW